MKTGKILYIHIIGLWGIKDIETKFDPNVNIFIGPNGSNKTVFLNLLEAALNVDLEILCNTDFKRIEIHIDADVLVLIIENIASEDSTTTIKYSLDDDEFLLQMMPFRMRRLHRYEEPQENVLRRRLAQIVNISWLSVNRGTTDIQYLDSREVLERIKNMVDIKIERLVKLLGGYQLQLETEANTISNDFKKEVMAMMLYNPNIDSYNNDILKDLSTVDINDLRKQLYKAFSTLGIAKENLPSIEMHLRKIRDVLRKMSQINTTLELNDVFILALVKRTLSIIDISQNHERQTKELYTPINNFWKCLMRFMPNKKFVYDNERGILTVTLLEVEHSDVSIPLSALSSGEKQIFILLTEALLQREKNYLFIADEPELSLHIKWQKKILPELFAINPNAQIIVATHSPEVASNYPDKIINMSNIIKNHVQ